MIGQANRISLYGPLIQGLFDFKSFPSIWTQRDKKMSSFSWSVLKFIEPSFFPLGFLARAPRPWTLNPSRKKSFCNLQDGPRTRLVRGTYTA